MEIKKICVLGAGLMGNGIAQVCAQAGYEVALRDIEQRFVEGGMNTIKKNLARDVEKGKMTQAHMEAVLGRITPTLDLKQAAAGADVVVEVVIEVMDVKKKSMPNWKPLFPNTACFSPTRPASALRKWRP